MEYAKGYGSRRTPPDRTRCAARVHNRDGSWIHTQQCVRKAKYDPGEDGKPTTCGVHSEERKAARHAKQDAKWAADRARSERRADIGAVERAIRLVELHRPKGCSALTTLCAILEELRDA